MLDFDPPNLFRNRYRIASTRLPGWDYASAGLYFVTICVKDRVPCFAEMVKGEVRLSPIGAIVAEEWQRTERVRPNVILDEWVIMPNHIHGIIGITERLSGDSVETPRRGVSTDAASAVWKANSLGSILGQFKAVCTKRIWASGTHEFEWQARFYDHIVRGESELNRIHEYIIGNPARWNNDRD